MNAVTVYTIEATRPVETTDVRAAWKATKHGYEVTAEVKA